MKERIALRWDVHEKAAPVASDRWAASDRGWLFAEITPAPHSCNVTGSTYVCLGHYLDYETANGERTADRAVHAVSCVTRDSAYFATPESARAWIESEANGRVASHFASQHNGYEHRKEAIRKMQVSA